MDQPLARRGAETLPKAAGRPSGECRDEPRLQVGLDRIEPPFTAATVGPTWAPSKKMTAGSKQSEKEKPAKSAPFEESRRTEELKVAVGATT